MDGSQYGVDTWGQSFPIPLADHSSTQIHDRSNARCFRKQSDLAESHASILQDIHGSIQAHFLKHFGLQFCHGRLDHISPDIVTKEKEPILVCIGLGDIEIAPNQGYQEGVENIIE